MKYIQGLRDHTTSVVNVSARFICFLWFHLVIQKQIPKTPRADPANFGEMAEGSRPTGGGWKDHVQLNINILLRDVHLLAERGRTSIPMDTCRICDFPAGGFRIPPWCPLCIGHDFYLRARTSKNPSMKNRYQRFMAKA